VSVRVPAGARWRTSERDERLFRWAGGVAMAVAVAWLALRPAPSFASFRTTPALALSYVLILAAGGLVSSGVGRDVPDEAAGARFSGLCLLVGLAAVALARSVVAPAPPLVTTEVSAALSVVAAVAEEALFRGGVFRLLEPRGAAFAAVASALLFALVHVPSYGWAAFPVDLGAGLLFSWQRLATGRWSVPAATHAAANLLAVMP
jgi:membrane protease YdiL (CAAX protease family)